MEQVWAFVLAAYVAIGTLTWAILMYAVEKLPEHITNGLENMKGKEKATLFVIWMLIYPGVIVWALCGSRSK